jgi:predicted dinucleotide-binding enzyme
MSSRIAFIGGTGPEGLGLAMRFAKAGHMVSSVRAPRNGRRKRSRRSRRRSRKAIVRRPERRGRREG